MARQENIERIKKKETTELVGNTEYWRDHGVAISDEVQPYTIFNNVSYEGKGREKKRIVTKESIYTSYEVIDAINKNEIQMNSFKKINNVYKHKEF